MATEVSTSDFQNLALSSEEAAELLHLLQQSLSETRIEVHRTHTPDFRDALQHREALVRGLIAKLEQLSK